MALQPEIKGTCPSAYEPMSSGDGLILRIKPKMGQITPAQIRTLFEISKHFGNGHAYLTNRANIQVRGLDAQNWDQAVQLAIDAELVDQDPIIEQRISIIYDPFSKGEEIYNALVNTLSSLPNLPSKFGYAVGYAHPNCDINFIAHHDQWILNCAGSNQGLVIEASNLNVQLSKIIHWFVNTQGVQQGRGRMRAHLKNNELPSQFKNISTPKKMSMEVGKKVQNHRLFGVAYGILDLATLDHLASMKNPIYVSADRALWIHSDDHFECVQNTLISAKNDPRLNISVCPGAPYCDHGAQKTYALVEKILAKAPLNDIHVSGCAKGCAKTSPAQNVICASENGWHFATNETAHDCVKSAPLDEEEILQILEEKYALDI